jgi:hypothetical protein
VKLDARQGRDNSQDIRRAPIDGADVREIVHQKLCAGQ